MASLQTGGRNSASAPRFRITAVLLAVSLSALTACSASPPPDKGLVLGPHVRASAQVQNRLAATFAEDASTLTTVSLTDENPHRVAAAVVALRNLGSPLSDAATRSAADWWSRHVLPGRGRDAALRIQDLRLGVQAFGPYLDAEATGRAATAAVRALTRSEAALSDVESAARLTDELRRISKAHGGKAADRDARSAVAAHLAARRDGCEVTDTDDVLPGYVAARGLIGLGYRCSVSRTSAEAVDRQFRRLAKNDGPWSVPDAVLLLQAVDAARDDSSQNHDAVGEVEQKARRTLLEALTAEGPYYRKSGVAVTEAAMASTVLAAQRGRSRVDLPESTAQALRNVVMLRGRIADQPDENSIVDGYLATLADAQLTGEPVRVKQRRLPAPDAPLRDHVRYFLAASLQEPASLSEREVADQAAAALDRANTPLDRLTLATSATLAAARGNAPCAVVDKEGALIEQAAQRVAAQFAQGSEAVKAWLALLWGTTAHCPRFQKEAAPDAAAFSRHLAAAADGSPTARAVQEWLMAELSCLANRKPQGRAVAVQTFASADDPGEGIGLGTFAALRTQEIKAEGCAAGIDRKLRE
ncbi:hypothetical protein ACIBU0_05945 [Streptomyces sp. NPDC049627]|uniref:hypothetical protein n=1 Tax=Streptomyces sp. NPDC049627 TaxID=3365595 RepID=UPI0037B7ECA7